MNSEDKYVYQCWHNGFKTEKEVDFDTTWMHQLEEFFVFLRGCGYSIPTESETAAIDAAVKASNLCKDIKKEYE